MKFSKFNWENDFSSISFCNIIYDGVEIFHSCKKYVFTSLAKTPFFPSLLKMRKNISLWKFRHFGWSFQVRLVGLGQMSSKRLSPNPHEINLCFKPILNLEDFQK